MPTWIEIGRWALESAVQVISGYLNPLVAFFLLVGVAWFIQAIKGRASKKTFQQESVGPPVPLSRVRMANILLGGSELLRLIDEGKKFFGDTLIAEILCKKERAWLYDIAEWLSATPYLKSEVLAEVFVPVGTSSCDAFTMRVAARIGRINSLSKAEIDP